MLRCGSYSIIYLLLMPVGWPVRLAHVRRSSFVCSSICISLSRTSAAATRESSHHPQRCVCPTTTMLERLAGGCVAHPRHMCKWWSNLSFQLAGCDWNSACKFQAGSRRVPIGWSFRSSRCRRCRSFVADIYLVWHFSLVFFLLLFCCFLIFFSFFYARPLSFKHSTFV